MRLHSLAPVVLLVALVASCHDATAPQPSLVVSLALDGAPVETLVESPQGLTLTCNVILSASAQGEGAGTWQDGMMRFYAGPSRLAPVDSQALTLADLQNTWGDRITAADHPRSNWIFSASVPFEVELEFRYRGPDGALAAPARIRFSCGPAFPAGAVAAPAITQLSVTPATGELQPGDTLHVTYAASSPVALWSTSVRITGGFSLLREMAERGQSSVMRTLDLVVPAGAQLGAPIAVAVTALDPGLQQAARSLQTQLTVVDRRPPVLRSAYYVGSPAQHLAGQFAVGDLLRVYVEASDDNALGWIVWELSGPTTARDSVRVPAGSTTFQSVLSIPVRADWVGSPTLSIHARDAGGLKSGIVSSAPDSLTIFPLVTHPSTTSVAATSPASPIVELGDYVYDARRGMFYIGLVRTSEIAVLDVASMSWRPSIKLPAEASGVDLTPGGDSLVVGIPSSRSLVVVSLARPSDPPTTIPLTVLDTAGTSHPAVTPQPGWVRLASNRKAIVSLTQKTRSLDGMLEVDLVTGAQKIRPDARSPSAYPARSMGATPDRSRIIINDSGCQRSYLSATDAFTACMPHPSVFDNVPAITFDTAGQRFAIGNGALDLSFNVLRLADAIDFQVPISTISPDGVDLYLGANQTVTRMNIADGKMRERFAIPVTAQGMFMSPSGDWLVVFQRDYAVRATRVDLR